jgi:hypothetical protein
MMALWRGPEVDGITFSLLSRFLVCRERFRLLVMQGLKPIPSFNHRLEFGSMWHVCEEVHANTKGDKWQTMLKLYAQALCREYPEAQEQVDHWYTICRVTFPHYVEYWKRAGLPAMRPLLQEHKFSVPLRLPSGRKVRLRGKFDSVWSTGAGKGARVFLQENKTKGEINESQITQQLSFDLQTMIYMVALELVRKDPRFDVGWDPIGGVVYNVVKRPLSGGKNSIRQYEPSKQRPRGETKEEFYVRVSKLIANSPGDFFMRWTVTITRADIDKFLRECLLPVLEQLCDWWQAMAECDGEDFFSPPTPHGMVHWRYPYGVWNPLNEGGMTELDAYLTTGSTVGLHQIKDLYPELK